MHPLYDIDILIIEDNPGDQFLLSELLKSAGFKNGKLSVVASAKEAIFVLEHQTFDIILLDLTLPDSTGVESFLALKKYTHKMPVVILSGLSDMSVALDAITMGAQDYLIKGDFDEKLLAKTILYSIERSNSLQALKESNERYDIISKATNDMIWDWDLTTGIVNRNKEGWKKILGMDEDDIPTSESAWDDRIHPDDKENVNLIKQHTLDAGDKEYFELECRIKRNNGTYAFIHDRAFILRNEEGKPIKLIGATVDITQRKEAELKLVNSEKRFRALIENSSEGLIIIDALGTVLDISPSAQRILGYSREVYIGVDRFDLIHPDYQQMVANMLIELVKEPDANRTLEYLYKKSDGNYIWIESTFHNQMHEPAVNAIVINLRDITERKKAEEELKKLSLIARETNNAVVITDVAGKIQWVNEAFTRITEYRLNEVIGRESGDFLQGAETSLVAIRYMRIKITNGRPFECDVINYKKSGKKYWIRIQCQPQFDLNGKLNGFFALETDITREKEADNYIKISEEKYRNLFDFNPGCIIIWDPVNYKVLEVNNKTVAEYGYSKEEFLSMTILDYRSPSDYARIKATAKSFLINLSKSYMSTWQHISKSGEMLPMHYVSRSIRYKGQVAILAMGENIKEKLKLEKALEDERNQKQFEITEAVISAQERERKEIGEELHDNVNQILAGSLLYLGLHKKAEGKEILFLNETEKLINSAIYELRNLSHSLIPPRLPESELTQVLNNIVKITEHSGITIHKDFNIEEKDISPKLKLAIYRIVQEQFTNILKHAHAENLFLSVIDKNDMLKLTIKDDGVGFDPLIKSKGVGLMNIKARASLFDSKVGIRSSKGKGCELRISFKHKAMSTFLDEVV